MKLRYQLCDFSIKSPSGKPFNKESMQRILDSDDFKSRLKSHDLMGTISHKLRWEEDIKSKDKSNKMPPLPQSDLLVLKGEAANCLTDIWIDGDALICELQVLQSEKLGKQVMDLIEQDNIMPDVSMVVSEDDEGEEIEILDFYGVDFTFLPALNTKLLATYSRMNTYQQFLMKDEDPDGRTYLDCKSKFLGEVTDDSPNNSEESNEQSLECYSIREFIRVRDRKPMQALQLIINDIKNYVRSTKTEKLVQQKSLILEYLTTYLFTKITEILSDKNTKMVNLNMILGLNRFCDTKAMAEFQRVANFILRQRKSLGYIDKRSQEMLAKATSKLILSMLDKIFKGLPDEKREIFLPKPVTSEDKNGNRKDNK